MGLGGLGAGFPNPNSGGSYSQSPGQYAVTSSSAFPPAWTIQSGQPSELPRPQLAVVRIVCWKCTKAEGKFLYQHGVGLTWCEECYLVMQLGGPTSAP